MFNKTNQNIPELKRAHLDQPIPIIDILESNESLPKMCQLHIRELNMLVIYQEI